VNDKRKEQVDRLENIWRKQDFSSFLKKFSTRPHLRIRAGNTIFYEGDQPEKLYFIKEGFVKLYRTSEEGRDTIIYLYGPGSVLGVRALTGKDRLLRHSAEALTEVTVVTIPRDEFIKAASEHPEILIDILHVFIERLNYTERKLEGFILTDSTARVASFLSDLAKRFGVRKNGKIDLPLSLTHQRIAEFVGSFRETVTISVNRLKKEGILKDDRGKITILDIKKLNEHALIKD